MSNPVIDELRRKIAHFSGVLWVIASYYITLNQTLSVLLFFFILALIVPPVQKYLGKIPLLGNLISFLHSTSRTEEKRGKVYYGAAYFFGSLILILFATQSLPIFRGAALVLIFGDGVSAIFGKAFGRTELPHNPYKSFEGSLAGFAAAAVAAIFVLPIALGIFAAAIAMFIESLPWDLNDNLTIPLAVGFFLWVLTAL